MAALHLMQQYSIINLNYGSGGKWERSRQVFSNLSFTVKAVLKRHPHYYVRSLINTKFIREYFMY